MKKRKNDNFLLKLSQNFFVTSFFFLFIFSCASPQLLEVAAYFHEIGDLYYEEEKFDRAAEVYRKSLKINPTQPAILYNLAMISIEEEDFSEARSTLNRFLKSDPENVKVQKSLAYSYFQEGNYKDAEKFYSLIYKKLPEDQELLYNIGTIRHLLKDYQGSQDAFQTLLDFTQGESFDDRAYQMIVINLISLEKFNAAARYRQQMLNKGAFEDESIKTISTLYRNKGETEQLYRFLSELDEVAPLEKDAAWEQITLSFNYEDFEDALEGLSSLLETEYKELEKIAEDLFDVEKRIVAAASAQEEGEEEKEEPEKLNEEYAELEKKLQEAEKKLKERRSQFFRQQQQGRTRTETVFSQFETQYQDKKRLAKEELAGKENESDEQENTASPQQ